MPEKQFLYELLGKDQEPFQLNGYIAERESHFSVTAATRSPPPKTNSVRLKKKLIPIVESSATKLCAHSCFSSTHGSSPEVRMSHLSFPSPLSSKSAAGGVLLHVPPQTAALLLEAATRVLKQQSARKPKTQTKNVGFGLFGSILKRLRNKKREITNSIVDKAQEHKFSSVMKGEETQGRNGNDRIGFSCSVNHSRRSSVGWSESNEEKSLDLETLSSWRSEDDDFEEIPCRRPPGSSSPAESPIHCRRQEKESYENKHLGGVEQDEEDEEEKEQCSPVSVLDPPFEYDNYGLKEEDEDNEDDLELECAYAIVQRAQQQLLAKLSRFEKLVELDPFELEKILQEEEEDNEDVRSDEVIPLETKKRVTDPISWNGLKWDSHSIDKMIEQDIRAGPCEWMPLGNQVQEETVADIEVAIFGVLVDEFSGELSGRMAEWVKF
ncbi:unnamed protein product [Cuscuta epithymum]|uniref:DUF4378 domain-containing protein n=1 Tax=Cuscuta epithymum TaxID=186058 RepID=A0AAV0EXL2_9ASTE|nr:unnamed protein product [Cuscuta epithymum]